MRHERNDLLTLVTKTAIGEQVIENQFEVFAAKKSTTRNEFYAAYEAGLAPKVVFEVEASDWEAACVEGEEPTEVIYREKHHNIIRSYQVLEYCEVICD